MFLDNDTLVIFYDGGTRYGTVSNGVFRDPSSWYHIVLSVDTTNATAANRMFLYVNGVSISQTSYLSGYVPQNTNTDINNTTAHFISKLSFSSDYFDGYLAEVNFIDGQALTPSSFGSTNALTGVWQPAAYTGTYGTNGFELQFTDNSGATATTIGKDSSGNGNNWTPNNISVTAGATYDSMTDVPTLTNATAANFAVLNPLQFAGTNGSLIDGNLTNVGGGNPTKAFSSTIAASSGKFYAEFLIVSNTYVQVAVADVSLWVGTYASGQVYGNGTVSWDAGGNQYYKNTTSATSAGVSCAPNDILQIAFDASTRKVWFGRNGTWNGSGDPAAGTNDVASVNGTNPLVYILRAESTTAYANFGQRPFAYTPPTGFVALNTFNLPTSTIVKGNTVMDATLWTGTGVTLNVVNAAPFKPDFVWAKARTNTSSHLLYDSIRGVNQGLASSSTLAEFALPNSLTAFNSNGFTVGSDSNINSNIHTYVGWQWQAGQGSSSSNTNGTITSTVSVNASAGFSVVTYTGAGAAATIGHGLGVAPSFYVVKQRNAAASWLAYHASIPSAASQYLVLDLTAAAASNAGVWNNTAPTSSVFSIGTVFAAGTYVAYCWTPIAGYSAFGSYTGNGSTDGPFVYTGFRPKFILYKASNVVVSWVILDTMRDPYNISGNYLLPNNNNTEANLPLIDILSNGFKLRTAASGTNGSGDNIVYMAFAENPFKNSLAR
jgi:hypothetical protein